MPPKSKKAPAAKSVELIAIKASLNLKVTRRDAHGVVCYPKTKGDPQ